MVFANEYFATSNFFLIKELRRSDCKYTVFGGELVMFSKIKQFKYFLLTFQDYLPSSDRQDSYMR